MKLSFRLWMAGGAALLLGGGPGPTASAQAPDPSAQTPSLAEARRGFATRLVRRVSDPTPVAPPPRGVFNLIHYHSSAGALPAYVSPAPADGRRHPVVIWLQGGWSNSIDEDAWTPGPADNDQSATVFRQAGLLMMYPARRGGNERAGLKESHYGEVDDVLAAADYLAAQPFVDPHRIYLGGHSTGGTLALLCAECGGSRFRAVFAFGPVDDLRHGNRQQLVFDQTNPKEWELRAPGRWLGDIRVPTFVFEGDAANANGDLLTLMARANRNPAVQFFLLRGADHFEKLQPVSRLIAAKILADTGPATAIAFEDKELNPPRTSMLSLPVTSQLP